MHEQTQPEQEVFSFLDPLFSYLSWGVQLNSDTPIDGLQQISQSKFGYSAARSISIQTSTCDKAPTKNHITPGNKLTACIHLADLGRLDVSSDRIHAEFLPNHPAEPFISGQGIALALELTGRCILHGCSLFYKNHSFAILGPSGSGKSTLSAQFIDRGAELINDDLIAIDPEKPNLIYAGSTAIRLWPDSIPESWQPARYWPRVHPQEEKRRVSINACRAPGKAHQLDAIFILDRLKSADCIQLSRLKPAQALLETLGQAYRPDTIEALGLTQHRLNVCALLTQSVPVFMLSYPDGKQHIPMLFSKIKSALA
ncbi:MAG: hypothetical protein ACWA5R_10730 [bacterium]